MGSLYAGILMTYPNHFRLLLVTKSVILTVISSCLRMSSFLSLSLSETPKIERRHLISKTFNVYFVDFFKVQDSEPYVAIGRIRELVNSDRIYYANIMHLQKK